jgi:hypothetical protein
MLKKTTMRESRERKIGNIFGATGGNHAGMVFDQDYLSPALSTMQGGAKTANDYR